MLAKIIQRKAKLAGITLKQGAPPEQDIPLKVPQKTTLFVELTQRERDQAVSKQYLSQSDFCRHAQLVPEGPLQVAI
jgi:hypothetical protein